MDHDKVRWVYCQAHNRIHSAQPGLSTPTPTYVLIFSMDPSWKRKSLQKGATLSLLGWTPLTASQSRHTIDSLTAACLSLSYQKVSNNWLLGPSSTIMGLPIGITTPFIAGPTLWFQSLLTTWRVFLPAIGPWPHYQCVGSFSVLDKTGVVFLFLWLAPGVLPPPPSTSVLMGLLLRWVILSQAHRFGQSLTLLLYQLHWGHCAYES